MTTLLRNRAARFAIVLLTLVGWLAISNHCAIAAVEGAAAMPIAHCDNCAKHRGAPGKGDNASGIECCKVLRATLLTPAKHSAAFDQFQFTLQMYATALLFSPAHTQLQSPLELDTGPPFAGSFAESVLQRSLLAHAPPARA